MRGQTAFGRDMLFNLTSIIDWHIVTARIQRQVDIDNVCKKWKASQVYAIGDLVYVKNIDVYLILDYKKQGPYIITEVFTNFTIQFQRVAINEWINIRQLIKHFEVADMVPRRTQTAQIQGGRNTISDNFWISKIGL